MNMSCCSIHPRIQPPLSSLVGTAAFLRAHCKHGSSTCGHAGRICCVMAKLICSSPSIWCSEGDGTGKCETDLVIASNQSYGIQTPSCRAGASWSAAVSFQTTAFCGSTSAAELQVQVQVQVLRFTSPPLLSIRSGQRICLPYET